MNKERQTDDAVRGVFALALVGGLLLATPARAQTFRVNETSPFAPTITNPCVPEDVSLEGSIRLNETTRLRDGNVVQFIANDTMRATGVGATTGANYSFSDQLKINIVFDADGGPLLLRTKSRLVSGGPTGNFFLTSVIRVSGDGQRSTTTFEAECRG